MGTEGSPEAAARLRESLGLNRPILVQYVEWLARARARRPRRVDPVRRAGRRADREPAARDRCRSRLLAAVFMVVVALPLGLYAATPAPARRRLPGDGRLADRHRDALVLGRAAAHPAVLGHLGWVQSGGFAGWSAGSGPALRSLLLPAVALGFFQAAVLVRATRSAVLDVLREDYVRTARAKGVRERSSSSSTPCATRMIPIVTVAGLQLGQLMAGAHHPRVGVRAAGPRPAGARRDHRARPAGGAGGDALRRLLHRR